MSQMTLSIIAGTISSLLAILLPILFRKIHDIFRHKFSLLSAETKEDAIRYVYNIFDIHSLTPDEALVRHLRLQRYGLWTDLNLIKSLFDFAGSGNKEEVSQNLKRITYIITHAGFCKMHQNCITVQYRTVFLIIASMAVVFAASVYSTLSYLPQMIHFNTLGFYLVTGIYIAAIVVMLLYFIMITTSIISLIKLPFYLKPINQYLRHNKARQCDN